MEPTFTLIFNFVGETLPGSESVVDINGSGNVPLFQGDGRKFPPLDAA